METETRLPYEKVRKGIIKIIGLKDIKDAATIQYRILLMDSVLRAKVDFRKEEAVLIFDEKKFKKSELTELVKPYRMQIVSDEEMDYAELINKTYNFP